MTPLPTHPLDRAVQLTRHEEGSLCGQTDPAYANMVGPFGGITAATLLQAVLTHPSHIGEPLALTVNYASPIADGPLHIAAQPVRTNRSTQHWTLTLLQGEEVVATASAVFAIRRETWSTTDAAPPHAPPAATLRPLSRQALQAAPTWVGRYDMRVVRGMLLDTTKPASELDSTTVLWVRDEPPRALDFLSLAALCDVFFPRIMVRRPQRVPAGTVSLTTYFHANAAMLTAQGDHHVLGVARASHFGRGYHDQSAEIWGADGTLLATTHQIVYYKE